jgi:hypothetical protein
MTVTSGTGKSDLHKQNLRVCFFNEQKCRYSGTRNIVILWTLVDNFFYNLQLEESYKSSMTDFFEPSEHGPSETKVGRVQSRDECQKVIALP